MGAKGLTMQLSSPCSEAVEVVATTEAVRAADLAEAAKEVTLVAVTEADTEGRARCWAPPRAAAATGAAAAAVDTEMVTNLPEVSANKF